MSTQEQLQAIYNRHRTLTPEIVLTEATDPKHPLHPRFEWDDGEAGHRYRLHQAQSMIRSVQVIVERGPEKEPIMVRAFVSESEIMRGGDAPPDERGVYLPIEEVVSNDVLRTAWFATLRRDWERLKKKAGASQEFAQMVLEDVRDLAG